MENFKEKIAEYIEKNKKNSKLNKSEVDEVNLLLKEGLSDNSVSIDNVIEILLNLHYSVTTEFIKRIFNDFDNQIKTEFIIKFLHNDKIVKNTSNFGISRSLAIVRGLLQAQGNDEFIHTILKNNSKKAYGKDGGKKAGELLSKICFEDTKNKMLLLDFSEWQETEMRNLSVWIDNAINYTTDADVISSYFCFINKYNLPKNKKTDVVSVPIQKTDLKTTANPKIETNNPNPKKEDEEKIVTLVSELQVEVNKMINEKCKLCKELDEAKNKLGLLNKDKESLLLQLSEISSRNSGLQEQIKTKEAKIIDAEKKITEMNERLEYAYKADRRAENQGLVLLKNDLVKQLKLDYDDFQKLATKKPAEYHLYYEGLVGIIDNIFDSLRRKGIVINNENEG